MHYINVCHVTWLIGLLALAAKNAISQADTDVKNSQMKIKHSQDEVKKRRTDIKKTSADYEKDKSTLNNISKQIKRIEVCIFVVSRCYNMCIYIPLCWMTANHQHPLFNRHQTHKLYW